MRAGHLDVDALFLLPTPAHRTDLKRQLSNPHHKKIADRNVKRFKCQTFQTSSLEFASHTDRGSKRQMFQTSSLEFALQADCKLKLQTSQTLVVPFVSNQTLQQDCRPPGGGFITCRWGSAPRKRQTCHLLCHSAEQPLYP